MSVTKQRHRGQLKRRRGRATTVVASLALATGLAACGSSAGSHGGFATPQRAVSQLLSDLSAGHYDQAAGDLAPGEAHALQGQLETMVKQLVRLGILAPGTDLDHFSGAHVTFSNPTYSVSPVSSTVDFVQFTGGTVNSAEDPSKLPLGSAIESRFASEINAAKPQSKTSPLATGKTSGLATVQVGGRWYVSLGYSAAESARRGGAGSVPNPSQSITPTGSGSPDGAVTAALQALLAGDLRQLLSLAPPDELGPAQGYASLFLGKLGSAGSTIKESALQAAGLSFVDEPRADGTLVKVKSYRITGTIRGAAFTYTNGCASITESGAHVQVCRQDISNVLSAGHAPAEVVDLVKLFYSLHPDLGFVTVQEGGKWYVSPTRTVLDDINALLASMSPAQANQVIGDIAQLAHKSSP